MEFTSIKQIIRTILIIKQPISLIPKSWEQVVKEHPGIDTKVVEYVALMHVATEIAQAADGLCNN